MNIRTAVTIFLLGILVSCSSTDTRDTADKQHDFHAEPPATLR